MRNAISRPDVAAVASPTMKTKTTICFASLFLLFAFTRAEAQLSYTLTDLGTLGGTMSIANSVMARAATQPE
jgi:hypothetical protein